MAGEREGRHPDAHAPGEPADSAGGLGFAVHALGGDTLLFSTGLEAADVARDGGRRQHVLAQAGMRRRQLVAAPAGCR